MLQDRVRLVLQVMGTLYTALLGVLIGGLSSVTMSLGFRSVTALLVSPYRFSVIALIKDYLGVLNEQT